MRKRLPRSTRRAAAGAASCLSVLVLLALAGAGCGVPVDRAPTALAKRDIPFHLLTPSKPAPTVPSAPLPAHEVDVDVFFLNGTGRLEAVQRALADSQVSPTNVLESLLLGPMQDETQQGLQTAIPPQTTILGTSVDNAGLATVNVGGTFAQLVGPAQIDAVAQIVFTATTLQLPDWKVANVTFQLNSQPVEVPIDNGSQLAVVNESDFASLAPATVTHPVVP